MYPIVKLEPLNTEKRFRMNWFKGLFGKEEETQIAEASTTSSNDDIPASEPAVASGKKLKLNFKRIPKAAVQAMADQTTGQVRPFVVKNPSSVPKGSLSNIFNQNAADITRPMQMKAPKPMGPKP